MPVWRHWCDREGATNNRALKSWNACRTRRNLEEAVNRQERKRWSSGVPYDFRPRPLPALRLNQQAKPKPASHYIAVDLLTYSHVDVSRDPHERYFSPPIILTSAQQIPCPQPSISSLPPCIRSSHCPTLNHTHLDSKTI